MLDRESAFNRVFLAVALFCSAPMELGFRFKPVFNLAAAQRSTMSSPLPYCRTNQTSSDVGMIGMITASARHRWTYRRRNGTKRKFFNDFSRARACAYAQGGVRSEHASLCRVWRAVCFKKRYLVRDRRQDRTALRCPAVRHAIWSRALYVEREIGRPFGLWQFSWPHFCRPSPGCFPVTARAYMRFTLVFLLIGLAACLLAFGFRKIPLVFVLAFILRRTGLL